MRVIAGKARGTKLKSVDLPSARPTLDRVKESIFGSIQYELRSALCLDAFACSGALGIEALSRGAQFVDFCEIDTKTFAVLRENLVKCSMIESAALHKMDVFSFLKNCGKKYRFVFADPPYRQSLLPRLIEALLENSCLHQGAMIVAEHEKSLCFEGYRKEASLLTVDFVKEKRFSDTSVTYFRVNPR